MTRLGEALKKARTKLNIERRIAYLGDGSGEVHDREIPGQYLVRFPQGSDTLGAPVSLPLDVNANLPGTDGLTVEIGERNGKPVILGAYYEGLAASAVNPLQLNPINEPANKFVYDRQLATFYVARHADTTNKPFTASIWPGFIRVGSTLVYQQGGEVDLTSLVPVSPNHCVAVVFVKTDGTLEAFASTAQDISDPFTTDDLQEALNSATAGSTPVWYFELAHDDTLLTVDEAKQGPINVRGGRTLVASDVPAHAHSIHTGLTTGDDHTQYFLLAGRAGGQTAYGGTAASENLILNSTSHGTKGNVLIGGSTLRVDEALTTVGIKGAAIAAQALTIYPGADANKGLQIRQNSATQSANLFEVTASNGTTVLSSISGTNFWGIGVAPNSSSRVSIAISTTAGTASNALTVTNTNSQNISNNATFIAYTSGMYINFGASGSNASGQYGYVGGIIITATHAGSASSVLGMSSFNQLTSGAAGTVGTFTGLQVVLTNTGANTVAITTWRGIIVQSPNLGGASLTNNYGIYIEDQNKGGTINSAIVTNAGSVVFNEGGDGNTVIRGEGDNDQYLFCTVPGTDRFGVGTNAAITKFHTVLDNATTNTVDNVVTIEHSSTGTPAAGFGAGLAFALESSTTAQQSAGRLTYEWVVATHASRTARGKLTVYDTAEREAIRLEASGTAAMLGFFGVNAVVRPTALTTALTTITHTAPGTPDYAIQNLTNTGGYGFVTQDEGNTTLSVIANLQTRVNELETKLQALGLLT